MISWLLALLFQFPAHADCERRYVVAFINTTPSYEVTVRGEKRGHSYDLLSEIVRRLKCKSTEEPGSFTSSRESFARNRVDIYGIALEDATLDQVAEFVPLYSVPRNLIVEKKFYRPELSIKSYVENPKIHFANVIGAHFFMTSKERDFLFKNNRLHEVPGPSDAIQALLNGRVQASFSSPTFTSYYLRETKNKDAFQVIDDPGSVVRLGFYLSKKRLTQQEHDQIVQILKDIKADGTHYKIAKRYVSPEFLKYYK